MWISQGGVEQCGYGFFVEFRHFWMCFDHLNTYLVVFSLYLAKIKKKK